VTVADELCNMIIMIYRSIKQSINQCSFNGKYFQLTQPPLKRHRHQLNIIV